MADNAIQNYIGSGILESYVFGALSASEEQEVMQMKKLYPEVQLALSELEDDIEHMAMQMAIAPPPALWNRIEDEINGLVETRETEVVNFRPKEKKEHKNNTQQGPQYIEVEAQSEYMKVHKMWRWIFAGVFVLGKIFLITALYFYFENRYNQQQVNELKAKVSQLEHARLR